MAHQQQSRRNAFRRLFYCPLENAASARLHETVPESKPESPLVFQAAKPFVDRFQGFGQFALDFCRLGLRFLRCVLKYYLLQPLAQCDPFLLRG